MLAQLLASLLDFALRLMRTLMSGFLGAPKAALSNRLNPIEIRRGRTDELIAVRHAVLRPGRPESSAHFSGDDDNNTRHWVADRNGIVIGVVSVMQAACPGHPDPAPMWQLRGMAVLPQYRGQHLGAELLKACMAEVDDAMWCNAREAVVPFYERYGWQPIGTVFDIPKVGPHQRMVWSPS